MAHCTYNGPIGSAPIVRTPVHPAFCGLDLSFTSSGWSSKRDNNITFGTVKTEPKDFENDLVRIIHIRDAVLSKIPVDVSMICVEDFFAGMHPGSGTRLAMLASAVRLALYERKMAFMVVSPNSLKKWIMGKGVGQKDLIVREVYKRYGIETKNDDESDAVVLACIAEHFLKVLKGEKADNAPKYQQEVVHNMMETRNERGFNLP